MKINLKNMVVAPLALMSLSACAYSDGYSQNNFAYADDQYCDPYNEYDAYHGCDLEYGFANFGYGGGWHQDFYYPGFGFFIFDDAGRRYRMNDYYLGYWGRKRQQYFQSRFSKRSYSGYRLRSFPWSERNGKRYVRDNRGRALHRVDRRDNDRHDRFGNRQERRQVRRDQRDDTGVAQRSERHDRRNERRQARRSDGDNARPPQNRQERTRLPRQNNNQPRQINPPPRQREIVQNDRQTAPHPPRIIQNQNNQSNRVRDRIREPHQTIPQDD